jgi:hypothetical protein
LPPDDAAQRIRKAILNYVRRHPNAADTVAGILERWLPRGHVAVPPDRVVAILQQMVADGELRMRRLPGRRVLFYAGVDTAATSNNAQEREDGSSPARPESC